jgi:hypothetical protein
MPKAIISPKIVGFRAGHQQAYACNKEQNSFQVFHYRKF